MEKEVEKTECNRIEQRKCRFQGMYISWDNDTIFMSASATKLYKSDDNIISISKEYDS